MKPAVIYCWMNRQLMKNIVANFEIVKVEDTLIIKLFL